VCWNGRFVPFNVVNDHACIITRLVSWLCLSFWSISELYLAKKYCIGDDTMFKAEWIWSIAMKQIWQKKPACFNNSWNKFKFQKGTTRHFKEKGANYVPYLPHPKSTTTCQLFSLKHFGHFSHSSIKTCHKSYSLVYFFRYYDLMDSVYLGHLKKQFSLWQKNDWKNKPSMKYLCLKELGKKIWKHKWQTYCFAPSVSHGDSASSFVIFSSWTLAALILIPPAFTESHATKNIRKKDYANPCR